ncbi:MAG: class I SAM-dependent methyltransferase [Deltaproteobacteria bacterium]|jgi:16S rRNA (guanine527-N7)-methyltransferase|nr:class I SAM-dependent methyltransferase [Deltaproteobacteria bacterium]
MTGDDSSARDLLVEGLAELDLAVSADQLAALFELTLLLAQWSKRINLTGHKTASAIVRGLILDAAALSSRLPEIDSLADIGSGAGFPGLPVAILRPGCRVTLVESRERRVHFQRQAIRQIGLENARAEHGRAEALVASPHAAAIAQAVAKPADALPLLLPWVAPGGWLFFPGSMPPPPIPQHDPRVRFEPVSSYRVPLGGAERALWCARKTFENAA